MSRPRTALTALVALAVAGAGTLLAVPSASADPTWTPSEHLSVTPGDVGADVVVAPDGTAVVGWVEEIGGVDRAVVRERTSAGSWSTRKVLSPLAGHAEHVRLGVDRAGALTAAWELWVPGDGSRSIQVARRPAGGSWTGTTTLAESTTETIDYHSPEVGVSPGGRVAVSWEFENGVSASPRVALRSEAGGWQSFSADAQRPGTISDLRALPDDTGRTTIVWLRNDGSNRVVRGTVFGGSQAEVGARELSSSTLSASNPRMAVNAAGRVLVAWTQQQDAGTIRVAALVRSAGSPFPSSAVVLTDAVTSVARHVAVSVGPTGQAHVVFDRANRLFDRRHDGAWWQPAELVADASPGVLEAASMTTDTTDRSVLVWSQVVASDRRIWAAERVAGTWGDPRVVSASGLEGREPVVAAAANGDAAVAWMDFQPTRQVGAAGLDGSGPVSTMPALAAIRFTTSVPVQWSAVDRWSAVSDYTVQRKVTAWNGNPGSFTTWQAQTTDTSASSVVAVGRTLCLRARARDAADNVGLFARQRCTTTPVDDRTAVVGAGSWGDYTGASHYRGTFRASTTKGSVLEWPGARGKTFDLVAATGPGHGEVAVWLGNTLLKTVSLDRPTARTKVVLPLRSLAAVSTGAVQVRVLSAGKPVRIDGIVVRR